MNNPGVVLSVQRVTKHQRRVFFSSRRSAGSATPATGSLDIQPRWIPFTLPSSWAISLTSHPLSHLVPPFAVAQFQIRAFRIMPSWWYSLTRPLHAAAGMIITSRESAGDVHRREDGGRHWRCTPGIPLYCGGLLQRSSPELQDLLRRSIPLAGVWGWLSC